MRNKIYLIACTLLATSCGTLHKSQVNTYDKTDAHARLKIDSTATVKKDSSAHIKTAGTHDVHTVSSIDTSVHIGADSLNATGKVPDPGTWQIFTDGDITTKVGVDSGGKLVVSTKVKAKDIPVRQTTTTDVHDTQAADIQTHATTDATVHVNSSAKVDSSATRKSVVKTKERAGISAGWQIAGAVLFLMIALAIFYFRKQ